MKTQKKTANQKAPEATQAANWALMSRVWAQDEAGAKAALMDGADAGFNDQAPLRAAIDVGHPGLCRMLLGHGAKASQKIGQAALGRGVESLIEAMADSGGFVGWDSESEFVAMGRIDWLQKLQEKSPMGGEKAHNVLQNFLEGARANPGATATSVVDFLCKAGAKPWREKRGRMVSASDTQENCLARRVAINCGHEPRWFPAFQALVRHAQKENIAQLAELLTMWSIWSRREADKKQLEWRDPAFIVERLKEIDPKWRETLSEATGENIANNAWEIGRRLFDLGGGEAGIARAAEKLADNKDANRAEWWKRINEVAKWSSDSKASFAKGVFAGLAPKDGVDIMAWLINPQTQKLPCADGLWALALQWADRNKEMEAAQWIGKEHARRESAALADVMNSAQSKKTQRNDAPRKKTLRV